MLVLSFAILAIFFLTNTFFRLLPESSVYSKGKLAVSANDSKCIECHTTTIHSQSDIDSRNKSKNCLSKNNLNTHPPYQGDCDDILAFFEIIKLRNTFPARSTTTYSNPLIDGERLARQYYCFQCHGELGQGGYPNKGSLKGYIPGYFGNDFRQLTNNGDLLSIKKWILYGVEQELLDRPLEGHIAKYFLTNQSIHMPNFSSLAEKELTTLIHYVSLLQLFGPLDNETIQKYSELSQKNLNYGQIKEILSSYN